MGGVEKGKRKEPVSCKQFPPVRRLDSCTRGSLTQHDRTEWPPPGRNGGGAAGGLELLSGAELGTVWVTRLRGTRGGGGTKKGIKSRQWSEAVGQGDHLGPLRSSFVSRAPCRRSAFSKGKGRRAKQRTTPSGIALALALGFLICSLDPREPRTSAGSSPWHALGSAQESINRLNLWLAPLSRR